MHVVIAQWTFHPNTLGWVQGLEARGHQVTVLVGKHSDVSVSGSDRVIDVAYVGWIERLSARLFGARRRVRIPRPYVLWSTIRALAPDLVLIKQQRQRIINQGPHVLWTSIIAGILRVPRWSWGNSAHGRSRRELHLARLGLMPRRHFVTTRPEVGACGAVGSTAPPVAQQDRDGQRDPVITYAPALGPVNRHTAAPATVRILTVGRLSSARKRVWQTLDAAHVAGLLAAGRVNLSFVGPGHARSIGLRALRERIEAYGCDANVAIVPGVPHEEMGQLYAAHDLVVVPARRESFGMVVLEAMACGAAVVVHDAIGAKCCVVPGVTGALYDGTTDGLAATLTQLCDDAGALATYGVRAQEFIASTATPEHAACAIERLVSDE